MSDKQTPPIYVLGICEKYNEPIIAQMVSLEGEVMPVTRQDLIGLNNILVSSIFPFPLDTLYLVFLLDLDYIFPLRQQSGDTPAVEFSIAIKDSGGKVVSDVKLTVRPYRNSTAPPDLKFKLSATQIAGVLEHPGEYSIWLTIDKEEISIGVIQSVHRQALPLTEEMIQAIKSDPLSAKAVHYGLSCKHCKDECKVYAGLEKKKNEQGYTWYKDLPDRFICSCKKLNVDLSYLKNNLHSLLGQKSRNLSSSMEVIGRNYSDAALKTLLKEFQELLEKKGVIEEDLQKFIEDNTAVFNCFSSQLLRGKSPVGSEYNTDFVILNQKNELLLVEIERADMPLFTKAGQQRSELTQAFNQVEDWLVKASRDRLGLIDNLKIEGLSIDRITNIKGVVIAGRSKNEKRQNMEKLHKRYSEIDFYTYDDLLGSLAETIRAVSDL